jgi:hypothetical protein
LHLFVAICFAASCSSVLPAFATYAEFAVFILTHVCLFFASLQIGGMSAVPYDFAISTAATTPPLRIVFFFEY